MKTKKIYLVVSYWGDTPAEYEEFIERGFSDINKAKAYIAELEDEEKTLRAQAERCRNCGGSDTSCPFYSAPFYLDDECESYSGYRENEYHRIDEIDYEE